MVVHGHTLFLYTPCCACRSSAPLRGELLSCVDKKVTKEATRGGTEVDPIEILWFRIPPPRIKTVLPGTSPGNTSSRLCVLSPNIRSNSDLSGCFGSSTGLLPLPLGEVPRRGGEGKWHHRHPLNFRDYESITNYLIKTQNRPLVLKLKIPKSKNCSIRSINNYVSSSSRYKIHSCLYKPSITLCIIRNNIWDSNRHRSVSVYHSE